MNKWQMVSVPIKRAFVGGIVGGVLCAVTLEVIVLPFIFMGLYGRQSAVDSWMFGLALGFPAGGITWGRRLSARRAAVGACASYTLLMFTISALFVLWKYLQPRPQPPTSEALFFLLLGMLLLALAGAISGYLTSLVYHRFAVYFEAQEPKVLTPRRQYSDAPRRLKI